MDYVNVLPGRVRFKSSKIYYNKKLADFIEKYINNLYGVRTGKVTAKTGSILIIYQTEKTNLKLLKENIESALEAKKLQKSSDNEELEPYHNALLRKRMAKNKLLLWSTFYLLLKIKSISVGKYTISRNLNVLKVASIVTIIGSYPFLKKIFKGLSKYINTDPNKLLEYTALSFTIARESSKGILLLILKSIDDYVKYSSEVESRKSMLDSNKNNHNMTWIKSSESEEVLVSADTLEIGSHYYVYPGEMVPACGIIEEGSAVVNNLYHTGQPLLSQIEKGKEIGEGIIVISGKLEIKVTELPVRALKSDVEIEKLSIYQQVKKFQNKMTLFAVGSAALSYLLTENILIAFSVMLVLSPKPTSVALSSGMNNYLYLLNKNKIYLQHPNTFEQVRNVDKVIFDKTGTLTHGKMKVVSITSFNHNYTELNIEQLYLNWLNEDKVRTEKNENILIGSDNIMKRFNIIIPPEATIQEANKNSYLMYVAVNKQLAGCVLLKDTVRENTKVLIDYIRSIGVTDISLLTGDTESRAKEVAFESGITNIYSQKTNNEKAQFILEAKKSGIVMMIGDGLNDVLAMKEADISVAFADNACEKVKLHSDCIIYGDNILKLSDFILFTQKSYIEIKRTMLISNLYNIFFGIIAFNGGLNVFTAKSLNTLNSILVLLLNKRIVLIRPIRYLDK